MGRLAQVELEPNAGDFRLLDRQALDALLSLRERSRFLRGMTAWVGFEQATVDYDREPRFAGETKFPLRRMLRFALDAVSSFSHFPLQLATLIGLLISAIAFVGLPLTVVARYTGIYERGVPSVLFAVLFIGGIQLMTLGVIGEYVGRIYDEVKRRPLYVVRRDARPDALDRGPRSTPTTTAAATATANATDEGRGGRGRGRRADGGLPALAGRPRVRRLRALAGPRRAGGHARRRRRRAARALLPPPVHQRSPHRRALRRARPRRRARVAAVERRLLRRRPRLAVHGAARPPALRAALARLAGAHGR